MRCLRPLTVRQWLCGLLSEAMPMRSFPLVDCRDGTELSPADCSEELVEQREKSKYASPHGLDSPFKKPEGRIRLPTEPLTPIRPNLEVCEAEC